MRNPNTQRPDFYTNTPESRIHWFFSKALIAAGAFVTALTCAQSNALAADPSDPVLNLLLQKGIISQQELDKAKAEAEAIRTNNASFPPMESKWKIGNAF